MSQQYRELKSFVKSERIASIFECEVELDKLKLIIIEPQPTSKGMQRLIEGEFDKDFEKLARDYGIPIVVVYERAYGSRLIVK